MSEELSVKGWNWGILKFNATALCFEVGHNSAFEIPLTQVSHCATGKNELTVEFHENDDAPINLMEMRFFIPSNELGDIDAVEAFKKQIIMKASIISQSGDAIATFREIQCLTPRGRYDIKIFNTFFQLHGKTFDYKISMSTVLRLFLLPHKDNRRMFFVFSLDPPIKQGQTRYHFLVLLFGQEEKTSIELPFSEEELKEKYNGQLEKQLCGQTYEMLGKLMKIITNRKVTVAGSFVGHSGTPAVGCSFKAAAGYLYPLERGFMYVHKPPIHIRFEEVASVNFARGGGSTRSFDFEIELKSGTVHTFSSIEKEEYNKLFDFITAKKLNMKNRGKNQDKAGGYDDFGDYDNEAAPDAYLERVKAEAQERDEDDSDNQSEDESTDEDFKPTQDESDVAEEFDSSPSSSSHEEDKESGLEKPRQKRSKKVKNDNRPTRPMRTVKASHIKTSEFIEDSEEEDKKGIKREGSGSESGNDKKKKSKGSDSESVGEKGKGSKRKGSNSDSGKHKKKSKKS